MSAPAQPSAAPSWRVRLLRGAIALLALVIGVAVLAALVGTKPEPPREPHAADPIVVRALTVSPVEVAREHRGYGVVRAVRTADVSAEVAGVIVEKPARLDEGTRVDRGELLLRIDPSDYTDRMNNLRGTLAGLDAQIAQLDVEADASREQAALADDAADAIEREIERLRVAADRGAATANEIDQQVRARIAVLRERVAAGERLAAIPSRRTELDARIQTARSELDRAERDIARTVVESPIAGVVQAVDVEVGERVMVGQRLARLVDASRLEVPLRLPLAATASLRLGDPVLLTTDGTDGERWDARIVRLAPEADASTRTITVYAELEQDTPEDRAPALPPGRFVLGSVFVHEAEPRIIVPRGAVADDRVMVIDDTGTARSQRVEVAYYIEAQHPELVNGETQWAVIRQGLTPGDRIAISNLTKLRPGSRVQTADARGETP